MSDFELSDTIEFLPEHKLFWPKYDNQCEKHIAYWKRHHEDWKFLAEKCQKLNRTKVCIQAGGSIGVWPQALSGFFDTVYTFEPHPDIFQCLVRNCTASNVVKMQAVLGNESIPINMRWKSLGSHWVLTDKNCGDGKDGIYPQIMIDSLNLPACDAIVLDVEGYEFYVLQGAKKTIETYKPLIQLEDKDVEYRQNIPANTADKYLIELLNYTRGERIGDDRIYYPN